MAIHVACPSCGAKYALPDATQIKVLACKACGTEVGLPTALPPRPEPPHPPTPTGGWGPDPAGPPPAPPEGTRGEPDPPRAGAWTKEHTAGCVGAAAAGIVIILVSRAHPEVGACVGVTAALAGVVLVVLRYEDWRARCLACGEWGARKYVGRELVGEEKGYGLVTRTGRTFSHGWGAGGRPVGGWSSSRWEERVPVVRLTYRRTFRCQKCGHETHREEVEEYEDFDRE